MSPTDPQPKFLNKSAVAIACARRMLALPKADDIASDHQRVCLELMKHRFCPPVAMRSPLVGLVSPKSALQDDTFAEAAFSVQLDQFCRHFYSMSAKLRHDTWTTLEAQLRAFPALHRRLTDLEPGLKVDLKKIKLTGSAEDLSQLLCRVFVMTPRDAAKSLRRAHTSMTLDNSCILKGRRIWAEMAQNYPILVGLNPPMVSSLAVRVQRTMALKYPEPTAPAPQTPKTPLVKFEQSYTWVIAIIIVIIVGILSWFDLLPDTRVQQRPRNTFEFNRYQQFP